MRFIAPYSPQPRISHQMEFCAGTGNDDPYETLTAREKQVLRLVALGHSNKEVAEFLGVSIKTAMSHREHVMEKLDLHSRTDVIEFAIRQGVIRVES